MVIDTTTLLRVTRIEPNGDAYILGTNESRITVLSQQMRALNVAYALSTERFASKPANIGVVGGGVAGVTASHALAAAGHQVVLYEQAQMLIPLQRDSTKRFLHPHLYDWPQVHWERPRAQIPVADWRANRADVVRKEILESAQRTLEANTASGGTLLVRQRFEVNDLDGTTLVGRNHAENITEQFTHDALVVACGFGREKEGTGYFQYWSDDDLDKVHNRVIKILVSGTGDGGIIDVLRASLVDARLEAIAHRLGRDAGQELTELVSANMSKSDPVNAAIEVLKNDPQRRRRIASHLLGELRSDTNVLMTGTQVLPWQSRSAFPLNRILVYLLSPRYLRSRYLSSEPRDSGYTVHFEDAPPQECERLVLRHGPIPPWTDSLFMRRVRSLADSRWKPLADLDATRFALYPPNWLSREPRSPAKHGDTHADSSDDDAHPTREAKSETQVQIDAAVRAVGHAAIEAMLHRTQAVRNSSVRALLPKPVVPEAFVSLALWSVREFQSGRRKGKSLRREITLVPELLSEHSRKRILIHGGPGAGKSTLLQFVANSAWRTPEKVGADNPCFALYIHLPTAMRSKGSAEKRVNDALEVELGDSWKPGSLERYFASPVLNRLLLLDGLDEIRLNSPSLAALISLLDWLDEKNATIIVACRTSTISQFDSLLGQYISLEIQTLTVADVERFARAQMDDDLATNFANAWGRFAEGELLSPLVVTMAIALTIRGKEAPTSRGALYRSHFELLATESQQRMSEPSINPRTIAYLLSRLALATSATFGIADRRMVLASLREGLAETGVPTFVFDAHSALELLLHDVGILQERAQLVEFTHPSFHEYFLARALVEAGWAEKGAVAGLITDLTQAWRDRQFSEAMIFAIELAVDERRNCTPLIELIVEATRVVEYGRRVSRMLRSLDVGDLNISKVRLGAEAVWYVARCLKACRLEWSKPLERIALIVGGIVLRWLKQENEAGDLEHILSTVVEPALLLQTLAALSRGVRRLVRRARDSDQYALNNRLLFARSLVVDAQALRNDVRALARLAAQPFSEDWRWVEELEIEVRWRREAIAALAVSPQFAVDAQLAACRIVQAWTMLDSPDFVSSAEELMLEIVGFIAACPDPVIAVRKSFKRLVGVYLLAGGISELVRDVRIRAMMRPEGGTNRWVGDLVWDICVRLGKSAHIGFPHIELLGKVGDFAPDYQRRARGLLRRWLDNDLIDDSYAIAYALQTFGLPDNYLEELQDGRIARSAERWSAKLRLQTKGSANGD